MHGNNYGDLSIDGTLLLTLEISFAHRGVALSPLVSRAVPAAVRAPLDAPNDPRRADYRCQFRDANYDVRPLIEKTRAE